MIEIDAEILRGSCMPVFFVGETVECEIRFKCLPLKEIVPHKKIKDSETQQKELRNKERSVGGLEEVSESMFSILSANNNRPHSPSMNSSLPGTPTGAPSSINNFKVKYSQSFSIDSKKTSMSTTASTSGLATLGDKDHDERSDVQTIAWSCAQIDCHCYIDETKVVLPKDPLRYSASSLNKKNEISNTSFQPNKDRIGISVYSSKPKILFCNLTLKPNESTSFIFKEELPFDLAPTFRGQFAKYTYKLTIGVQKLNRTTQLLRLPLKVYSLLDFDRYIPKLEQVEEDDAGNFLFNLSANTKDSDNSFDWEKFRNSPFKIVEKNDFQNLEYALQILEDLTARNIQSSYNVTTPEGKIVKISVNKTNYKIGDKIVVFLDFTDSQVSCVEYKVTLQSEEIVSEECRKKPSQAMSSVHSHTEIKYHCFFLKKTDLTLQIPVHVTPTFVSDIISLRWRLHFDFALCKNSIQQIHRSNDPAMSVSWRPPNTLNVEVISWDLPIVIHPFDPFVASDLLFSANNFPSDTNHLIIK